MGYFQHFEVVKLIQTIPDIQNDNMRNSLLIGIPHAMGLRRDHANAETDINLIVADLAEMELETGEMALSIVIENALNRVDGHASAVKLKELLEKLRKGKVAKISPSSHSFHTWRFDLHDQMNDCLSILLEGRGLFGFAISCDSLTPSFYQNFCERLKHELYRADTKIKVQDPVVLDPVRSNAEYVIRKIKRYKQLLQSSDVICVIHITSGIGDDFWQSLNNEFSDHQLNRLIIIMVGSIGCIFPNDAINFTRLKSPKFTKIDIHRWVGEAIHSLQWSPDKIAHLWKNQMFAECSDGNALDIGFTYECLSDYVRLLQQGLTYENFISKIEEREKNYV